MVERRIVDRLARWRVPLGFICGALALWLARPTISTITAGGGVALAGESLRVWASGHLNKAREVTSSGPYRWMAHPLYVGSSVLGVGLAVAAGHWIVTLVIAVYLALTLSAAIRSEEAFLRRTFGDDHRRYKAGATDEGRRFRAAQAIANGEHRTVIGIVLVLLVLLVKALAGV